MAAAEEERAVERCCSDTSQGLISLAWVRVHDVSRHHITSAVVVCAGRLGTFISNRQHHSCTAVTMFPKSSQEEEPEGGAAEALLWFHHTVESILVYHTMVWKVDARQRTKSIISSQKVFGCFLLSCFPKPDFSEKPARSVLSPHCLDYCPRENATDVLEGS